jgi:glycosyltransferase involved in cell wall biosynthesis
MRLAYFSPLPPQRTGVADYSRELLPELVRRAEVDLWVDTQPDNKALPECRIFNYLNNPGQQKALRGYDAALYHMGNSPAHRNIYHAMLAAPGIVVMHDFVLHHFFASYYLESRSSPASYIEEMAYNYGRRGEALASNALMGRRQIWEHEPLRYPLNYRVLDHARGVIVHSEFARGLIARSHPHLPSAKVDLAVSVTDPAPDPKALRQRFGLPEDRFIIGSLGFGSAAKRLEMVLRAIRALGSDRVLYLVVGELGATLRQQVRGSGMENSVRATGYVEFSAFNDYCNLIDLGVDLRYPTMGESSASVCRMMGAGKPCVVSNVGWFAEIPDGCAIKLPRAADERMLVDCLSDLISDDSRRRQIGGQARRYIRECHSPRQAAARYVDFVNEVRLAERGSRLKRTVIDLAGRAMAEIGVGADDDRFVQTMSEQIAALLETYRSKSDPE